MCSAEALRTSSPTQSLPAIKEDSFLLQAISCIPIVGTIPSLIQQYSLVSSAGETLNCSKLIAFIEVKNKYIQADLIRTLQSVALLVVGIALSILPPTNAAISTILFIGAAAVHTYRLISNNNLIDELRKGTPPHRIEIS